MRRAAAYIQDRGRWRGQVSKQLLMQHEGANPTLHRRVGAFYERIGQVRPRVLRHKLSLAAESIEVSDDGAPVPPMVFEVGMTVWRKSRVGWEQGRISGQVFDHDCWYITTRPGSTYVANGRQLRAVGVDRRCTNAWRNAAPLVCRRWGERPQRGVLQPSRIGRAAREATSSNADDNGIRRKLAAARTARRPSRLGPGVSGSRT
jgi:hypothetical protein